MTYFSEWLKEDFPNLYAQVSCILNKYGEQYGLLPHTKDYWCRDYMPIPLHDGTYLQYRYYPNYLNNNKDRSYITDTSKVCDSLGLKCIHTDIILDGGNIIRCGDRVLMIDKIFNENPNYNQTKLVAELEQLLNAEIVLLPWDKKEKYGHIDGVVRFLENGKVLLTNYHDYDSNMHERFRSILKNHFQVEELNYTHPNRKDNSWSYINFLQTEKVIIVPQLGTHKDVEALDQLKYYFQSYEGRIEQVDARELVKKGGALNCISWNT